MLIHERVQQLLTVAGTKCDKRAIHFLNAAINYLEVGRWFAERQLRPKRWLPTRNQIFDCAASGIAQRRVLYMEFGVFRGDSTRYWSRLLHNPESQLHGFDSFEGLPEHWTVDQVKGTFSTGGRVPAVDDPRVVFFKGWFDETLPRYVVPKHDVLFINIDVDLYSSTRTVLHAMRPYIREGTYIYFDEFSDRNHELKAFNEFLDESGIHCELMAANRQLSQVLFRVVKP